MNFTRAVAHTDTSDEFLILMRIVATLGSQRGRRYMRGTSDTLDWFVGDGGRVLARERYNNNTNVYRVQWRTDDKWTNIYEEEVEVPDMAILGVAAINMPSRQRHY